MGACVFPSPVLRGRSIDGSRTFISGLVLRLVSLRLCPARVGAGARPLLLVLAKAVGVLVLESSSSSIVGNGTVGEGTPVWRRESSRSEGADRVVVVASLSGDAEREAREMFEYVTVGGEAVVSGLLFAVVLPLCSGSSRSLRTDARGGELDISSEDCILCVVFGCGEVISCGSEA